MGDPENFTRSDWPNSHYSLLESEITGDFLWLKVFYSGCGPHDLNVVFYNYFMESIPIQAHAVITHRNELCDAVFISDEMFDLSPLKKKYQQLYGGENGEISISIQQNDSTLKQLLYNF